MLSIMSHQYKKDFPRVFKGLGKLKNVYKIYLDETAQPFSITTPRRIPLPMKQKPQKELKRLEKENIHPLKMSTDWCAPIVAVLKNNGKVRLCVDFTKLNESVKRKNFPISSVDQLLAELNGTQVFSKLDCNSEFHQIVLHKDSQKLTTFITPFGRYCYERLPFGISSGPEIFREMTHFVWNTWSYLWHRWCPCQWKKSAGAWPVAKNGVTENGSSRSNSKWKMCILC